MPTYREAYRRSIEEPEAFWAEQARRIHWQTPFEQVLDASQPPFARWFIGGQTNLYHNAVDRHLATRATGRARCIYRRKRASNAVIRTPSCTRK